MGEVWEAVHRDTHARVAVKVMHPSGEVSLGERKKFLDEARLGELFAHPNLVRVVDVGTDASGDVYLAMELLVGQPLSSLLAPHIGRLPVPLVVALASQALLGLDAIHTLKDKQGAHRKVVHRDIKPSNLFLTEAGVLKIIDFGIAVDFGSDRTRTKTGHMRGSLPYSSPEQAKGELVDVQSDLFSLGLVVHELLTGRRVFHQDNDAAVITALLMSPIPNVKSLRPEVPDALATLIARLVERDRERRPRSAADAHEALQDSSTGWGTADVAAWLSRVPRHAPSVGTQSLDRSRATLPDSGDGWRPTEPQPMLPAGERSRRKKWMAATVGVALGGVGAGAVLWSFPPERSQSEFRGVVDAGAVTVVPQAPVDAGPAVPVEAAPETVVDAGAPKQTRTPKKPGGRGFITVDAQPTYGHVFVDGKDIGPTPVYRHVLPAGSHVVEVVRDDGVKKRQSVNIKADDESAVRVNW